MKRKVVFIVGLLALLLGINMQVSALNPAEGDFKPQAHKIKVQASLDEWMPDKNLQDALVRALGLKDTSELTPKVLGQYQGTLDISGRTVCNIQGLEYATGVSTLRIGFNFITDVSPLKALKQVKVLDLKHDDIKDISPLSEMTGLEKLEMSNNKVTDLTPLRNLQNLEEIIFHYNEVKDLTVLKDMPKLHILKGTMQGAYNEQLTGEVGEVIKQKNNVLSLNGTMPDLEPYGGGSQFGKYDKETKTVQWTYDKPGSKVGSSKFYTTRSGSGFNLILEFGGTITQPIRVGGDQTSISVRNSTLYVGETWNPANNIIEAINKDGEPINIRDIKVEGNVDTTQAGVYKAKYTIINAKNEPVSQEATITVLARDKTSIEVKNSTLYVDDQWQAQDNFIKATDENGNAVDFKDVTVEGQADTTKDGVYKVTYSILNRNNVKVSKEATITVKKDQTTLRVDSSSLHVGDAWNPADNIIEAIDADGKTIDIKDIVIGGEAVDTSKEEQYLVKFTIYNHKKEPITKEARVFVSANLTSLKVKDSTIYLGDKWQAEDNLVKATDADGNPVGIDKITVEGSVDTNKEGTYKVWYRLMTGKAGSNKYADITVKKDETNLEVKDSKLYRGEKWLPGDNIVKAVDKDGKDLAIKDIIVEGGVDTSKEGISKVKYTILNHKNEKIIKEATITVKENQTDVQVKDFSFIYIGDSWKPEDNFIKATDADGNPVGLDKIDITGTVDTNKEGIYEVTYGLSDHGVSVWATTRVHVQVDKTSIEVKDSTLFAGDTWNKEDNFVKATDKDGRTLTINDVTVEGSVDTNKATTYEVTYTILNHANIKVSKIAEVTIKADQTALEVKDSTLYAGDTWKPEDNIIKALDKDGKAISINDINVEGTVDTKKEGTYKVKYTILNYAEEKISKEATIIVKGDDLTRLEVKDSTLYAGDTWKPEDNVVEALDKNGNVINIKDITVEGNVVVDKEGVYKVKYTIVNHANEKITKEATITVKENDLTQIEVKDSQLYVGQKWNPADNVVKATDRDGKTVDIKDIILDGQVDTSKAGIYEVAFSVLNHKQEKVTATASILVIADQTSLEVKDSTLYIGDAWKPEDNFVKATDKDGNPVAIDDVEVIGNVDTTKEGIYTVSYEIINGASTKVKKEAVITVKTDETALEVKGSVLYLHDQWNPQDNIVKALDKDGKVIDIKDIAIDSKVNTAVAGDYMVKFTILNHKQEPVVRPTIVKVKEDLTSLEVKDSILYFTDRWEPEDNLVKATDKDGNPLDIYDIKVEGNVDIKTAGEYPVKYTVLNHAKEKITKVATITMKGHDLTYLQVDDSTLYVGDTWNPADNLIKARDKDGKELGIEDVMVEGNVDTSKPGTYEVVYAVLNHRNEKLSNIATITVKEDKTSLQVKDTKIRLNSKWQPVNNLVRATDQDGNIIKDIKIIKSQSNDKEEKAKVIVEGKVNTRKVGKYKVTYTLMNHANKKISKKVTVTVQKKNNGNGDGSGNGNGHGNGKDGKGNLPKTGYDMSFIGSLLGLAGILGFGSLYLNRRERKE